MCVRRDVCVVVCDCFSQLLAKADAEERQRRRRAAMHKPVVDKPRANEVWCNVTGRTGALHASISLEGVVTDRYGELLGYIHLEDLKGAAICVVSKIQCI